jgi:hypothetical protein
MPGKIMDKRNKAGNLQYQKLISPPFVLPDSGKATFGSIKNDL